MTRLYAELQDNFERMKRTERLSALGQLSAGLAHEIRNPLASIDGANRGVAAGDPPLKNVARNFYKSFRRSVGG